MTKPTFKSREEKVAFLKDVAEGKRSIDEITPRRRAGFTYKFDGEKVVIFDHTGRTYTREEAKAIRNRSNQDMIIHVRGKPSEPAYKMFDEDKPTNLKIGRHLCYVGQEDNEPIEGEEY